MARPTSSSEDRAAVRLPEAASELEAALRRSPEATRRRLLTALVKVYASEAAAGAPVDADALSAEDAATFAAALLRAKDVTTFELAALFNV